MDIKRRIAEILRDAGVCEVEPSCGNFFGCTPEVAADAVFREFGVLIRQGLSYGISNSGGLEL